MKNYAIDKDSAEIDLSRRSWNWVCQNDVVSLINALNEELLRKIILKNHFQQLSRTDENHFPTFRITRICHIKMESRSFTGKNFNSNFNFSIDARYRNFKPPILRLTDIEQSFPTLYQDGSTQWQGIKAHLVWSKEKLLRRISMVIETIIKMQLNLFKWTLKRKTF